MAGGDERMRSFLGSSVRPIIAGALLGVLAACGGDSPRPPVIVVTPEPVRGVIFGPYSFQQFESGAWYGFPLPLPQRGKLDITIDWTASDTWMYVYLGKASCEYAQLVAGTCPFIVSSETKDPKPRVLFTDILEPATYYLYLYNVPRDPRQGIGSDNTESVSILIGQTVGIDE
jgi:hypothetical protein